MISEQRAAILLYLLLKRPDDRANERQKREEKVKRSKQQTEKKLNRRKKQDGEREGSEHDSGTLESIAPLARGSGQGSDFLRWLRWWYSSTGARIFRAISFTCES